MKAISIFINHTARIRGDGQVTLEGVAAPGHLPFPARVRRSQTSLRPYPLLKPMIINRFLKPWHKKIMA
jgi:hypothetical protein